MNNIAIVFSKLLKQISVTSVTTGLSIALYNILIALLDGNNIYTNIIIRTLCAPCDTGVVCVGVRVCLVALTPRVESRLLTRS